MTANPASVSASTTKANTGNCERIETSSSAGAVDNSAAKKRRNTAYSAAIPTNHGAAINTAKRVNDRPALANARRLVKFDTGSSSDAVLARWALA